MRLIQGVCNIDVSRGPLPLQKDKKISRYYRSRRATRNGVGRAGQSAHQATLSNFADGVVTGVRDKNIPRAIHCHAAGLIESGNTAHAISAAAASN